ncbi:hypothetical protein E2C06_13780 [Dankookia rubra]|uniref:Uncharacterized protein n=1 Tax=Dankookia rubra TaxID=1442381 RepID=A0A4R5QGI9_9PROT|nr:hypothetical protein [Dankookia rubra]TDH62033.1 hypothetical protein E2C06_13780 [Dankookia rubra]
MRPTRAAPDPAPAATTPRRRSWRPSAPRRDDPCPWVAAAGCLRPAALPALRRDFPVLPRPGYHPVGTFTPRGAFARCWPRHGHTPPVGERRVVQVAWLRHAAAPARKTSRGRPAWWLKGVFGVALGGPG